jgi:hypothetical protein
MVRRENFRAVNCHDFNNLPFGLFPSPDSYGDGTSHCTADSLAFRLHHPNCEEKEILINFPHPALLFSYISAFNRNECYLKKNKTDCCGD